MSEIIRENYELSIWERKNTSDENLLMIIGSSSMTSPYRATQPIVKTNVNGEKTLVFNLYSRYFDNEIGEFVKNPFINYIHNEALIKLRRGTKWYEFIIKDINESSDSKVFTYTAKGAEALELGKTGYGLTFNSELMNNTGTAVELTRKIFEGTDWYVEETECDKFWGATAEPLYAARITATDLSKISCIRQAKIGSYELYENSVTSSVAFPVTGQTIYIPYSNWNNIDTIMAEGGYLQFLWDERSLSEDEEERKQAYETDEEGLIYTANSYIWKASNVRNLVAISGIDSTKKGDYLQNRNKGFYVSNIDKVVTEGKIKNTNVSNDIGKDAFFFEEVEYLTSSTVSELIVNNKNFETDTGWDTTRAGMDISLSYEALDLNDILGLSEKPLPDPTMIVSNSGQANGYLYNAAIRSNATYFKNGISQGDNFKFKLKAKNLGNGIQSKLIIGKPTRKTADGETYDSFESGSIILSETSFNLASDLNEIEFIISFDKGVSYNEIVDDRYGLYIYLPKSTSIEIFEMSFYRFISDEISPGVVPEASTITTKKYILKENLMAGGKVIDSISSIKDVTFYTLTENEIFVPSSYGTEYEKISSIEISKSNRFNALQTVCEAFECWADLVVQHTETGHIAKNANNRPIKKIILKRFIGDNKDIGFSYGVNLKSISRQLISDQIVTKLIVEQNNNELANSGFCTIVRARDNQNKTNFIYNFDYYINQRVLDPEVVKKDLYESDGLLAEVTNANNSLLETTNKLNEYNASLVTLQAETSAAKEIRDAAENELRNLKKEFKEYTNLDYNNLGNPTWTQEQQESIKIKSIAYNIRLQQEIFDTYNTSFIDLDGKLSNLKSLISAQKSKQQSDLREVNQKISNFENKYASFIQEGTWTDEGYTDDDLYYYDAKTVLYNSAFPKVNYTINVIDLSPLGDEYSPFKFKVGDKTYMEDVEFFGWNQTSSTPYREEVVVSQMEEYLDSPEQNKITVQNYKTQFEDLFQRISATTQSLQYAAGAYQRAANKITSTNELDAKTLQNSLLNNIFNLQNLGNLSVSWTEKGLIISSTDTTSSNKKIRLSNTGLDLSVDGGVTWRTAITGDGIVATEVNSGSINTNKISIKSGEAATFIWDAKGLRSYETIWNPDDTLRAVNFNNYIEFNDNGLIAYKLEEDGSLIHPFKLTSDGQLELTGKITAREGEIGGWLIEEKRLVSKSKGVGIESDDTATYLPAFWAGKKNEAEIAEGVVSGIKEAHSEYKQEVSDLIAEYNKEKDVIIQTELEEEILVRFSVYDKYFKEIVQKYNLEPNIDYYVHITFQSTLSPSTAVVLYNFTTTGLNKIRIKETYNANFFVTHGGSLYAKNATIGGHIDATSGSLRNLSISGQITISEDGSIQSTDYEPSADGWCIKDNLAEFNTIVARGSLKVAVFEYGEVSAVGGIILVRPSTLIKNVVGTEIQTGDDTYETVTSLIVEDSSQFNVGDWCVIGANVQDVTTVQNGYGLDYKTIIAAGEILSIGPITDNGKHRINFTKNLHLSKTVINHTLISVGRKDENNKLIDNVYITINSSSNNAFAVPKSITIGRTKNITETPLNSNPNSEIIYNWERENKVVLGEFQFENNPNPILRHITNKYGLWAEDAIVSGILASYVPSSTTEKSNSAGLWSSSNIPMTVGNWTNKGNIIFWAGESHKNIGEVDTLQELLQNAPLQVDNKGHLYAKGAYIEGYIEATGGKIGNVTIEGIEQAAYSIDILSSKGTGFSDGEDSTTTLTCRIYKGAEFITPQRDGAGHYYIDDITPVSFVWKLNGTVLPEIGPSIIQTLGDNSQFIYECEVTIG